MLKKPLIKISGNKVAQSFLNRIVIVCQYLMGIGTAADVKESGEATLLKQVMRKSGSPYCIFDVGAHKGEFTRVVLDELRGKDMQVHCFEPESESFRSLVENFKGVRHVILNNFGLGREKGETYLYFDRPGSGLASLTRRRIDHFGTDLSHSETVNVDTIDNYCSSKNIKKIDLLKIDVEGHELEVLEGATETFREDLIGMLSFEFGGCNIDTRTFFQDFYYFFKERNMSLYRITPSGYLYPIKAYLETDEQFRMTNYLAVREVKPKKYRP